MNVAKGDEMWRQIKDCLINNVNDVACTSKSLKDLPARHNINPGKWTAMEQEEIKWHVLKVKTAHYFINYGQMCTIRAVQRAFAVRYVRNSYPLY